MSMEPDKLREWIGAHEHIEDVVTSSLVNRFRDTLGLSVVSDAERAVAPRLIHFCLCQPTVPMAALGEDGHPDRGGFLPPVALPRRMWAASEIAFEGDLLVGERVRRASRIVDVAVKQGRSGILCFVTVDHRIEGERGGSVADRQTIVYREAQSGAAPAAPGAAVAPLGSTVVSINPVAPLLFRYSALTFNGHRIHYDLPYATEVEGYPGLVVHGPLQATLLLHLAAREYPGRAPSRFAFRSAAPLFNNDFLCLHTTRPTNGSVDLWTTRPGGPFAMRAQAQWL